MCENPRRERVRESERETILLLPLRRCFQTWTSSTAGKRGRNRCGKNASLVQIKGANVPFIAAREVGNDTEDGHK